VIFLTGFRALAARSGHLTVTRYCLSEAHGCAKRAAKRRGRTCLRRGTPWRSGNGVAGAVLDRVSSTTVLALDFSANGDG
jgi:hypothetical protein